MKRYFCRLALALAIFTSWAAAGDGWTQWRGPHRDGRAPSFQAPEEWPAQLAQRWKRTVGAGFASPLVQDGRIYLHHREGTREVVEALKLSDGRRIWRADYPAPVGGLTSPPRFGRGPRSTPALAEGRLFTLGITGILSAWNVQAGKLIWQAQPRQDYPDDGTSMSPLLVDGLCIVQVGEESGGQLMAFEAASGRIRWSSAGGGPSYASPVLAEWGGLRQIVTFTFRSLVSVALEDGRPLWKVPFHSFGANSATPVVHDDLVIVSGYNLGTRAYRVKRAGQDSRQEATGGSGEARSKAAADSDWTVQEAWRHDELSNWLSTPLLKHGKLYSHAYSRKGRFFCLDARSGRVHWTGEGRQGGMAFLLDVGRRILAAADEGVVRVFEADSSSYRQVAEYPLTGDSLLSVPVLVGDNILLRAGDSLVLYGLP